MPDHGHLISSPCEPNGSGELKTVDVTDTCEQLHSVFFKLYHSSITFHPDATSQKC